MSYPWDETRSLAERQERMRIRQEWTQREAGAGPHRPQPTPRALSLYVTLTGALAVSLLAGLGAILLNYLLWTWLLNIDF